MTENGYSIENIVFSGALSIKEDIDLNRLITLIPTAYRRERFPALFIKTGTPGKKNTFSLYRTGKFIATGNKTLEEGSEFINGVVAILKENGIGIDGVTFRVVNMVSTADFDSKVDLDKFITDTDNSRYEPEIFPGVIHQNGHATFLIFKPGRFVCLGLDSDDKIKSAITYIRDYMVQNKLFLDEDLVVPPIPGRARPQ